MPSAWAGLGFRSFRVGGVRGGRFLGLVLAELVGVLSLGVAGRAFLVPGGQLDAVLFQDEGHPRRGLSAVSEIEPDFLLVKDRFLGLRVIIADLGNNTTRERVALRFLDDYPVPWNLLI